MPVAAESSPSSGPIAAMAIPAADREQTPRKAVFVCGSVHNGAGAFAGVLRELGAHVPQPEVVPDETDARRAGKPDWVVDLHTELLERVHVGISDARPEAWTLTGRQEVRGPLRARVAEWLAEQFAEGPEVVVTDPRMVGYLGLWRVAAIRVAAEPVFVTVVRHPADVLGGTHGASRREAEAAHTVAAWINGTLAAERATRGSQRRFVRYRDLLSDWTTAVHPVGEALGIGAVQTAGSGRIRRAHRFLEPAPLSAPPEWDDLGLPPELIRLAQGAWELLDRLADDDVDETHQRLDAIDREYADYYRVCEAVATSTALSREAQAAEAGRAIAPAEPRQKKARPDKVRDATPHWLRAAIPARVRTIVRARMSRGDR